MKKLLLISALAALTSLSSYGQGSVTFANTSTSLVRLKDGTAVPRNAVGGTYVAELLYAADGSVPFGNPTADAAFGAVATRVGATASFSTPAAGVFSGGGRTITSITPPGGFGLFQARVWDTRAGTTFQEAALNTQMELGYSAVVRVDTADPTALPLPTPAALGLSGFTLSVIPEPSTIALGLLGVGTLLMLRRRK